MKKGFLILTLLLFVGFSVSACAPKPFTPAPLPEVKFEPTPNYELDLSNLPKPDKIEPRFLDENFKDVPIEKAKYILLAPKEYAKIAGLLKYAKALKDITEEQKILINTYISQINALKELSETNQAIMELYRQLWVDSENAYRQERHAHKVDNAINRGALGAISIGSLVMLLIAIL